MYKIMNYGTILQYRRIESFPVQKGATRQNATASQCRLCHAPSSAAPCPIGASKPPFESPSSQLSNGGSLASIGEGVVELGAFESF